MEIHLFSSLIWHGHNQMRQISCNHEAWAADMLRRMVKRTWVVLAVASSGLLTAGSAVAANLRGERSVAGVRATLSQYDTALLAGNGKTGCALLTKTVQKKVAAENHVASCAEVFTAAEAAFKSDPKDASALRGYAGKVQITLSGDTASAPKFGASGRTTLTYTHGLWYLS
jgi:uncharacterized protein YbjT (DUF2867 family)